MADLPGVHAERCCRCSSHRTMLRLAVAEVGHVRAGMMEASVGRFEGSAVCWHTFRHPLQNKKLFIFAATVQRRRGGSWRILLADLLLVAVRVFARAKLYQHRTNSETALSSSLSVSLRNLKVSIYKRPSITLSPISDSALRHILREGRNIQRTF